MLRNLALITFISIILSTSLQAQDISLGAGGFDLNARGGGFFDYSDPQTINIKVSVWGYVQYPGRYQIPIYTTPADLLSYAGGPLESAEVDNIRIYRVREDGSEEIIKLNYNDLIYENQLTIKNRGMTSLKAGDILVIPGGPKYYFQDFVIQNLIVCWFF